MPQSHTDPGVVPGSGPSLPKQQHVPGPAQTQQCNGEIPSDATEHSHAPGKSPADDKDGT